MENYVRMEEEKITKRTYQNGKGRYRKPVPDKSGLQNRKKNQMKFGKFILINSILKVNIKQIEKG